MYKYIEDEVLSTLISFCFSKLLANCLPTHKIGDCAKYVIDYSLLTCLDEGPALCPHWVAHWEESYRRRLQDKRGLSPSALASEFLWRGAVAHYVAPGHSFLRHLNESRINSMGIYIKIQRTVSIKPLCKICFALHCDSEHAKLQTLWINTLSWVYVSKCK